MKHGEIMLMVNSYGWAQGGDGRRELHAKLSEVIAEQARRAACFDELVAALERLQDCYSVSHSPEARQSCWDQARAALANAKGKT